MPDRQALNDGNAVGRGLPRNPPTPEQAVGNPIEGVARAPSPADLPGFDLLYPVEGIIDCQPCRAGGGASAFLTAKEMVKHLVTAHPQAEYAFVCRVCGRKFPGLKNVQCHLPKCKGPPQPEVGEYRCSHCDNRVFGSQRGLSQHEVKAHPVQRNLARMDAQEPKKAKNREGKEWTEEEVNTLRELEIRFEGARNINVLLEPFFPGKTNKQISSKRSDLQRRERRRGQTEQEHARRIEEEDPRGVAPDLTEIYTPVANVPSADEDDDEAWRRALAASAVRTFHKQRRGLGKFEEVGCRLETIAAQIRLYPNYAADTHGDIQSCVDDLTSMLVKSQADRPRRKGRKGKKSGGKRRNNRNARRRTNSALAQNLARHNMKELGNIVAENRLEDLEQQRSQAPPKAQIEELYAALWGWRINLRTTGAERKQVVGNCQSAVNLTGVNKSDKRVTGVKLTAVTKNPPDENSLALTGVSFDSCQKVRRAKTARKQLWVDIMSTSEECYYSEEEQQQQQRSSIQNRMEVETGRTIRKRHKGETELSQDMEEDSDTRNAKMLKMESEKMLEEAKKRRDRQEMEKAKEKKNKEKERKEEVDKESKEDSYPEMVVVIQRELRKILEISSKENNGKIAITKADQVVLKEKAYNIQELLVTTTIKYMAMMRELDIAKGKIEVLEEQKKRNKGAKREKEREMESSDEEEFFKENRRRRTRTFAQAASGGKEKKGVGNRVVLTGGEGWKTPPRHGVSEGALVVSSKEEESATRLAQQLAVKIRSKDINGPPPVVRIIMDGKLVIVPKDNEQKLKLEENLKKVRGVEFVERKSGDPLIMISGVEKGMGDEELVGKLIRQNEQNFENSNAEDVKIIRRTTCRNPWKENIILRTKLENFKNIVKRGKIELDCQLHFVEEYLGLPICYRCCRFGHVAKYCKEKMVCYKCTGEHDGKGCQSDTRTCANCFRMFGKKESHEARNAACPALVQALEKSRRNINYENGPADPPSFFSNRGMGWPDLTLTKNATIRDREVEVDEETLSDHRYVTYYAELGGTRRPNGDRWRYETKDADWAKFERVLNERRFLLDQENQNLNVKGEILQSVVEQASREVFRRKRRGRRERNEWWSEDLNRMKRVVNRERREFQQARGGDRDDLRRRYIGIRNEYKKLIKQTKLRHLDRELESMGTRVWEICRRWVKGGRGEVQARVRYEVRSRWKNETRTVRPTDRPHPSLRGAEIVLREDGLTVWTDATVTGNGEKAGAWLIMDGERRVELSGKIVRGEISSNEMEGWAIWQGILEGINKIIQGRNFSDILICTDSEQVVQQVRDYCTRWWTINGIQREIISALGQGIRIRVEWRSRREGNIKIVHRECKRLVREGGAEVIVEGVGKGFVRRWRKDREMEEWQRLWTEGGTGRWLFELWPQVNRQGCAPSAELTQVSTGHGPFKAYLRRFRLGEEEDDECECGGSSEDVRHAGWVGG
ncbi:hypothetical protein NQ315_000037 [Exocentrus adspersus]|uniref:CCHC-type domain-containing protein n=1 Tax=Exocentrus adspersus TaxID=1586481 RepID=A0AAV8VG68_9CUCU|nr:hypothetical protein NQ315_000037 [Exocentrus adspersus]